MVTLLPLKFMTVVMGRAALSMASICCCVSSSPNAEAMRFMRLALGVNVVVIESTALTHLISVYKPVFATVSIMDCQAA